MDPTGPCVLSLSKRSVSANEIHVARLRGGDEVSLGHSNRQRLALSRGAP